MRDDGTVTLTVRVGSGSGELDSVDACVNGEPLAMSRDEGDPARWVGAVDLPADAHYAFHSVWRPPYGSVVSVVARDAAGRAAGAFTTAGGI